MVAPISRLIFSRRIPIKHILVYGSLKSTHAANYMLKGKTEFVGKVRLPGYNLYRCGWYPGIRPNSDNRDGVECELYVVTDESVMESLDRYEGYHESDPDHSLFVRKEVQLVDGPSAFVYEYGSPLEDDRLVPSGVWDK